MSCDCVDTLLRSLFLCVCLGVAQTIREAAGVSVCGGEGVGGGMSGQIPEFRATSRRAVRPELWTKRTFSCDVSPRGRGFQHH